MNLTRLVLLAILTAGVGSVLLECAPSEPVGLKSIGPKQAAAQSRQPDSKRASLELAPIGQVKLKAKSKNLPHRSSPDGRWLVLALEHRRNEVRRIWGHVEFALIDLHSGELVRHEKRLALGHAPPVFSRNSRWMAYCDEGAPAADGRFRVMVRRVDLRTGSLVTFEVGSVGPEREIATLAAIDETGKRVALIRPGKERPDRKLVVQDLASGDEVFTLDPFKEPYYGGFGYQVILTQRFLLSHTRPKSATSGGSYRLLLTGIPEGRTIGSYGSFVSSATSRYFLSRDGKRIFNGTGRFEIEEIDVETGEATTLFPAREELYSHFLELSASPNEQVLVAWSGARRKLVGWNRTAKARFVIELDDPAGFLGIGADNRHALLTNSDDGLVVVDLEARKQIETQLTGEWTFARLDPTGQRVVLGHQDRRAKEWTLEIKRLVFEP